jgi:general secretion pathway protein K
MKHQRGVILISALILVALAAIVATTVFFETAMSARRTVSSFSVEQALQLGQGAEALAAYALGDDKNQEDTAQDDWAQPYGPFEVETGISVDAQLTDEQAKFNINSLLRIDGTRNDDTHKVFQRLLELSGLEKRWADQVVDWIDADTSPGTSGGEDTLYTTRQPPHLAANQLVSSISELQQMPGFTREMYLKLAPHITALPIAASRINVCLADGVVLDSLYALSTSKPGYVEHSSRSQEEFDNLRTNGCFPKRSVLTADEPKMAALTAERTSYFRLRTWIRIGTSEFALYSLMYRDPRNQARAIARTFGTE